MATRRRPKENTAMKKLWLVVIGLCLCSVLAIAAPKDESWTGWISDSKCGAKGANAAHAACAKKCIAGGEKPVLVTDKDQKVVAITNPDSVQGLRRPAREGHGQVDGCRLRGGQGRADRQLGRRAERPATLSGGRSILANREGRLLGRPRIASIAHEFSVTAPPLREASWR